MTPEHIKEIMYNSGEFNIGTPKDAPSSEWINKAQECLGIKFPSEYLWFINNFGGGDIAGDEIYSIYELPFKEAIGGDIVYQNTVCSDNIKKGKLVFLENDFNEQFYFKKEQSGKVFILTDNHEELYCNDFFEFLEKYSQKFII